jgi:RNA polymerase sigma-70 factor (ECF subfamily)
MKYQSQMLADTRSSVLKRIRNPEDREAWERFYDLYADFIFSLARRRGLQEADASDVVQIVLIELAQKIGEFEYSRAKGRFRSWLATCTSHRIKDALRKRHRRQKREVTGLDHNERRTEYIMRHADPAKTDFEMMIEQEWQDAIKDHALRETREHVSAKQFELFHAYVIEEWPVDRVMNTYAVSRDQVYQAKRRVGLVFDAALKEAEREMEAPEKSSNNKRK